MTAILTEFWEQGTFHLPMWPSAPGGTAGATRTGAPVERGHFCSPNASALLSLSFLVSPTTAPPPQVRDCLLDMQVCV